MKILLINKFLYPKGGAETYVFKLGELLTAKGHQVEYFGLEHKDNIVGNTADAYVSHMDFSEGTKKNLLAPFRIIYSWEARKKLALVLNKFQPDIIHLNNIQFHLTPSIILEAEKYRKRTNPDAKIIYTVHDYQLICPSHGLFDAQFNICEKCLDGNYTHCVISKCHKNSRAKSILATIDAYYWKFSKAYSYVDTFICPSAFLKGKLDTQKRFAGRTVPLHNFIQEYSDIEVQKEPYVFEFGHLSKDKGTLTLLEVARRMPDVKFVFAGFGSAVDEILALPNAEYVGFKTGEELKRLIASAYVSVCPTEIYENCPYSVIESQLYGTPVVGSQMGGIPELIKDGKTGLIFEAGNSDDLESKLRYLLESKDVLNEFTENCKYTDFETPDTYYDRLIKIYGE